jgi:hypothetical protein
MMKSIVYLLMFAAISQVDVLKKEMVPLQDAVDTVVTSSGARIMSNSKAGYLEGYGIVVTMEVALEQPPNIFSKVKSSQELKASVAQRRKGIKEKLGELLKQRVVKAELAATESMAIIVHLMNTTPNDVPDLPSQVVISVKKDAPGQVNVREY